MHPHGKRFFSRLFYIIKCVTDLSSTSSSHCVKIRFHLGEVYRKTGRIERAKDCLLYALELEKTQPLEPFSVLPRIV